MTQEEQVLRYMKSHGSITVWEAMTQLHITRLAAVIWRLRKDHDIETITRYRIENGKRIQWAEYRLK